MKPHFRREAHIDCQPMFVMTTDGGILKGTSSNAASQCRLLQRVFVYSLLTQGISVTLLRGAEYRDSKACAFSRRLSPVHLRCRSCLLYTNNEQTVILGIVSKKCFGLRFNAPQLLCLREKSNPVWPVHSSHSAFSPKLSHAMLHNLCIEFLGRAPWGKSFSQLCFTFLLRICFILRFWNSKSEQDLRLFSRWSSPEFSPNSSR